MKQRCQEPFLAGVSGRNLLVGTFFFFSFFTIAWTEGDIRAGVRLQFMQLQLMRLFLVWLKQNIRKCYGIATRAGHIGRILYINLGILKTLLYYQTVESGYTLYQSKFMELGSVLFEANCGQITAPDARSHWLATFPQYSPVFCCVCDSNIKLLLFVCFFTVQDGGSSVWTVLQPIKMVFSFSFISYEHKMLYALQHAMNACWEFLEVLKVRKSASCSFTCVTQ